MWSASKILHVFWLVMASRYYFRTYQDLTCTWDEGHYSSFFVLSIRLSPNLVISTSTFILLTLSRSGLVKGSAGWSLCGVPHWWSQVGPHFCFHWWKPGGFLGGSDGEKSTCSAGDLVWSLGWEDPLEEGMATRSSVLVWRIPWTEGPGGLQSSPRGRREADTTECLGTAQCWPELQSGKTWRAGGSGVACAWLEPWGSAGALGPGTVACVSVMVVSVQPDLWPVSLLPSEQTSEEDQMERLPGFSWLNLRRVFLPS